jgi:Mg-chelatase subunit ChlD
MSVTSALNSALGKQGLPVTTAISLVVDRSGSMSAYKTNVVNSVTSFINDQKELRGSAFFTLAQFDDQYDVVFRDREIKEIDARQFDYSPRGGTCIRDALVRAVRDMEAFLKGTPAKDQPKRLVVALITDGMDGENENSVEKV